MAISKDVSSAKRFGARYGRTTRHMVGKIESVQRKLHKCPYCRKEKAKRISSGIWGCKSCGSSFTGRAYTLAPVPKVKKVAQTEKEL